MKQLHPHTESFTTAFSGFTAYSKKIIYIHQRLTHIKLRY